MTFRFMDNTNTRVRTQFLYSDNTNTCVSKVFLFSDNTNTRVRTLFLFSNNTDTGVLMQSEKEKAGKTLFLILTIKNNH